MSSETLIGQTLLNRFRVDAFIASGGMAAVYRVWDRKRNTPLAMKVLHADLAEDDSAYRRFRREAKALEKLAHPNIVPFYGIYRARDFDFLLEGFVNGPTLKQILRRQGSRPLPVRETLIYLKAISAALSYAHSSDVVHCDVKPGNVMVDPGGNIYLTDFGIARHAESTTTTLGGAGTPAYMAPEQIREQSVTAATDVYALGLILFEMLTGQRPFRGEEDAGSGRSTAERIRAAHLKLTPPDPRSLNPNLPEALALVVLKALQKDPNRRYASTQAMLAEACAAVGLSPATLPDRLPPLPSDESFREERHVPPTRRTILGLPAGMFFTAAVGVSLLLLIVIFALGGLGGKLTPNTTQLAFIDINTSVNTPESAAGKSTSPPSPTVTSPPTSTPAPTPSSTPFRTPIVSTWQQGKLVFSMRSGSATGERALYTLDLSNLSDPELLLPSQGKRYMASVWSPDGSQIAFYEQSDRDLLVIAAGGGQPRLVASGCYQPGWLPGGNSLVCKTRDGSTRVVDATSGADRPGPVAAPGLVLPDWSPLGDALLYAILGDNGAAQIYLVPTSGGEEALIAGQATENYAPAWSHDGRWIAYQSNLGSDWSEVWIMDRNGNNTRQLTDSKNGWFARGPAWSPDDRWIAYVYGRGGGDWGDIYVVPVDGSSDPIQVTHTGGEVYDWRVHWGP